MALSPGTRLGPYEITAQIGVGGMGEVWRATDANLGRQVALKVLPDTFAHDPERLARFEREAKTLAALSHPNIAIIYGLEKADGTRALVMELVEGPTLADRIARIELEEAHTEPNAGARALSMRRERLLWMSVVALLAVIAAAAMVWSRATPTALETRLEIATPPTMDPVSLAISRDARTVAFVATDEGRSRLWLRRLDSGSARPLPGTDGAYYPFWSPDNRSIGFFADAKLKRIDLDTTSVQVLANASAGRGGTWNGDGVILFAPQ